jgi:response regulator RpfG family c-di-GMP phosphodiesterase
VTPQTHKRNIPARVLLVGDTSRLRSHRAIMLSTHGYEVESIPSAAEAGRTWRVNRPDLVLLALTHAADETFALWRSIRKSDPQQRMSFLVSDSQYLCPVFFEGVQALQGEGPENIVERVRELLGEV